MEILSLISIILAMAMVIYGVTKGYSLIILSAICSFFVIIVSGMNITESFGKTYMTGMANFVITLFPLFLSGVLFGKLLEVAGLSQSIANTILKLLGKKNIVLAFFLAVYLMTLTGISVYVIIFTVYPLSKAFFSKSGISKNLTPALILGAVAAAQMVPGTPIAANVIPAEFLGSTVMAAPITAIIGAIIVTVLNLIYLIHQANKSIAENEGKIEATHAVPDVNLSTDNLPNALLAVIPFAVVIVTLNAFKWPAWGALFAGVIVTFVMFIKKFLKEIKSIVNDAAKNSMSVITTASIVGFGAIVAAAPGYAFISNWLGSVSFGNPYIYAAVAVTIIASVTGSATGSMRLILDSSASRLLAMGANPHSLSRIFTMSSFGFDSLPHSSAIVLTLNCCEVTHKEGYKHLFVTTVLTNTLAVIVGIITASLGIV